MKRKFFLPLLVFPCALSLALWGCNQTVAQDDQISAPETTDTVQQPEAQQPVVKPYSFQQLFADFRRKPSGNPPLNVVWHGHSVVAGYHKSPENRPFDSYPFLVFQGLNQRFPTVSISNITTAIGGENSVKGAARFERDVLTHHPNLLFIDYAINDRSVPIEKVEKSWRSMIESAKQNQIPLILITPTGTRFNNFKDPKDDLAVRAELIRKLGKEYDLPVADVSKAWQAVLDSGTPQESLLAQGLHPNRKGHEIATKEILRTIDETRKKAEAKG